MTLPYVGKDLATNQSFRFAFYFLCPTCKRKFYTHENVIGIPRRYGCHFITCSICKTSFKLALSLAFCDSCEERIDCLTELTAFVQTEQVLLGPLCT